MVSIGEAHQRRRYRLYREVISIRKSMKHTDNTHVSPASDVRRASVPNAARQVRMELQPSILLRERHAVPVPTPTPSPSSVAPRDAGAALLRVERERVRDDGHAEAADPPALGLLGAQLDERLGRAEIARRRPLAGLVLRRRTRLAAAVRRVVCWLRRGRRGLTRARPTR
ncbi:hypothetical protein GSI_05436 [Ganoderma sinense ZZ0214-1]|uniref:Uncharacterized protein n=1 Tax=Ganoderma sinense ZZ0214-1 TaxID=1077348 RepID=A0A2G8SEL2_9APHY|nr:hypothetical protein GSI_05436 [Ganoderma sinense ZZ0214-1]